MRKKVIVAPSLLAADFRNIHQEVTLMLENGITYLHFDVMDGHFVPNLSFGIPVLQALKPHYPFVYDVHLMISNPLERVEDYIKAGADIVTFHYEVVSIEEALKLIKHIQSRGVKAGISVKPNTPIEVLLPLLSSVDLVLVMSVEPGFGGQSFMPSALDKIAYLDSYKKEYKSSFVIEVDGGVNEVSGPMCVNKGADILVAGSYLFGKKDLKERIAVLKHE